MRRHDLRLELLPLSAYPNGVRIERLPVELAPAVFQALEGWFQAAKGDGQEGIAGKLGGRGVVLEFFLRRS